MFVCSGGYASGFKLRVSREMTQLQGRILQPLKMKLGDDGHVRDITPARNDRQWNLQDSHVPGGTKIKRWALISFGGWFIGATFLHAQVHISTISPLREAWYPFAQKHRHPPTVRTHPGSMSRGTKSKYHLI